MRRSISDIVAVVLLIVIAIAAAVIIYMWLSGLIGAVHSTSPALSEKVEIVGASITPVMSSSGTIANYTVTATVLVPQGSSAVTIAALEVESTNGTLLCTASTSTTPVSPETPVQISGSCSSSLRVPAGTPVEVVVVTTSGVTASYQTTVS